MLFSIIGVRRKLSILWYFKHTALRSNECFTQCLSGHPVAETIFQASDNSAITVLLDNTLNLYALLYLITLSIEYSVLEWDTSVQLEAINSWLRQLHHNINLSASSFSLSTLLSITEVLSIICGLFQAALKCLIQIGV